MALGLLLASTLAAQELTPRTYWLAPAGSNGLTLGLVASRGDFTEDSALPVQIAGGRTQGLQVSYTRFLDLGGRTATVTATLPAARASFDGTLSGEYRGRDTSGLADAWARVSVNLTGGPTMDMEAFRKFQKKPKTLVGASMRVRAPTGHYDTDKLLNIGGNRWSFKPELGVVWPIRPKLIAEIYAGVWFFTENTEFFGQTMKQNPLGSAEIHLIYRVRPGFWASFDWNAFSGGRTSVDGVEQLNSQKNSRTGVTVSIPFKRRNAVRIGFSTPLTTAFGGDYETLVVGVNHAWK